MVFGFQFTMVYPKIQKMRNSFFEDKLPGYLGHRDSPYLIRHICPFKKVFFSKLVEIRLGNATFQIFAESQISAFVEHSVCRDVCLV